LKSYTDLEQSKKLAEILPLESADGFWEYHDKWCSEGDEWEGYEDYPRAEPYLEYTRKENEWKEDKSDVPCWSLAALLEIIPYGQVNRMKNSKKWEASSWKNSNFVSEYYVEGFDTPIDACYEMILKLHELKML
jgi:hypothetical protein